MQPALPTEVEALCRLLQASGNAFFALSAHGYVLQANSTGAALLGRTPVNVEGCALLPHVDPEFADTVTALLRDAAAANGEAKHAQVVFAAGGKRIAGTASCVAIRDTLAMFVEPDVDASQSSAHPRMSEQRFQQLFDAGSIGMALIDARSDTFLDVNAAFLNMVHGSRAELIGADASSFLRPKAPADQLLWHQEPGNYELAFESSDVGRNGGARWVRTTVSSVRDEAGTPVLRLLMLADITDRKQLEEQLEKAQRMETIGQLAGGIAHDFNNLLMLINGYAQVLVEKLGEDSPLGKKARMIEKTGLKAANLTAQLLAFSRRQVLSPKVISVDALIHNFEAMISRIIGEDIDFSTHLESAPARVSIDPSKLEQVLMNLVVNARDAMPNGGRLVIATSVVTLTAEELGKRAPMQPGTFVLISVSDTGKGMEAPVRARIFEPFFTTKEVGKGTGLGLSTVYGIVRQSQGFIWVETEVGVGSRFEIYLPIERAPLDQEHGDEPAKKTGSDRVLLVEDEEEVREMLHEMLTSLGYQVTSAANGRDALELMRAQSGFRVVVTDSVMPGFGGRELAKVVRSEFPQVKVLLISGYAAKRFDDEVLEDASIRFLQKPFALATLSQVVRELLDCRLDVTRVNE